MKISFKFQKRGSLISKFCLHCLEKRSCYPEESLKLNQLLCVCFCCIARFLYKNSILGYCSFFHMQELQLFCRLLQVRSCSSKFNDCVKYVRLKQRQQMFMNDSFILWCSPEFLQLLRIFIFVICCLDSLQTRIILNKCRYYRTVLLFLDFSQIVHKVSTHDN